MTTTNTTNLSLAKQGTGDNNNTWGTVLNDSVIQIVDQCLGSKLSLSVAGSADVTLTTSQSQNFYYSFTGILTGNISVIFPSGAGRTIVINNATTGSFTLSVKPSGGTALLVPQGATLEVLIDGTGGVAYNLGNVPVNFEVTLASATTTDLGSVGSNVVSITGTTTITAFGSSATTVNCIYFVRFTGILTLTHNGTSLILPGASNITTAAGDTAIMKYEGSGNWRCLQYQVGSINPTSTYAPINSPTFTGTPLAPTATAGTNSTQIATTAFVQNNVNDFSNGFANKFRNGTFDVWQRGTSGTITAGSPAYSADGWIISSTGANVPWVQTAGRASTAFGLKVTGATSVTDVLIKQRIESNIAAVLFPGATAQVTVQAKVYNSTGGSITPTLTVKHATAADNWSGTTTDINAVNLQPCSNATLTTVSYTFASVSGTANGLEVTIDFGNNFSTNGKSVEVFEWDIRATPGFVTGLCSNPPLPELRMIPYELNFCKRYLPAYNASSASQQQMPTSGTVFSTTDAVINYIFDAETRVPVTGITVSSAAHFQVISGGVNTAPSGLTIVRPGSKACGMDASFGSPTVNADASAILTSVSSSAQILFTGAEL